jgi:TRAP-type mannitol/chloroaromatic compound transport system substrate-binding protein
MQQFGVIPVALPWEDIEMAVQTGELDGVAWSGITEDYTVGWADVTNYYLTNPISGAWAGSYYANSDSWNALPERLKTLFRAHLHPRRRVEAGGRCRTQILGRDCQKRR